MNAATSWKRNIGPFLSEAKKGSCARTAKTLSGRNEERKRERERASLTLAVCPPSLHISLLFLFFKGLKCQSEDEQSEEAKQSAVRSRCHLYRDESVSAWLQDVSSCCSLTLLTGPVHGSFLF